MSIDQLKTHKICYIGCTLRLSEVIYSIRLCYGGTNEKLAEEGFYWRMFKDYSA